MKVGPLDLFIVVLALFILVTVAVAFLVVVTS